MTVPFLPPRHNHITPLHTEQACSPGAQRAVFPRRAPPALAPPAPTLKAPFCWKAGPAATESPHTRARELGLHPASQTHLEAGRSQGPTGQPGPRVDVCASGANTSRAPRFWPVRLGGLSDQQPIPSTIWHRAHSRGPSGGQEAGRRASAVSPGLLSQQQLGPRDLCRGQPAGQDTSVDRKWGVGDTQGTDERRSGVPLDQWGSPACRLLPC